MVDPAMKMPLGTQAATSEICPQSGVWKALGNPTTSLPFRKGDQFPPYKGEAVIWQLRSYS